MTPPPPDKQPAAETLEEIVEGIARRGLPFSAFRNEQEWKDAKAWLMNEMLSALRNERKRAVRIIDEHQAMDVCEDNCWTTIKKAIREGR